MKVIILAGTRYIGLDDVVGKVLEGNFEFDGVINVTGFELNNNGAMEGAFRDEGEYAFRVPQSAIIVEEPCGGCNGDECDLHAKSYHEKK